MEKRIIYKREDGGISIVIPTVDAMSFFTIEQIAEKDVPSGLPYWIVDVSMIPIDRTDRNAWEIEDVNPDGFGGECNEFDTDLLQAYLRFRNDKSE